MATNPEQPTAMRVLFSTIKRGFDTTTKHPWLLIVPLIIDLLYWIGPRLRITKVAEPGVQWWLSQLDTLPANTPMPREDIVEVIPELIERTNLFTQMTLPMMGVPSLMDSLSPEKTPIDVAGVMIEGAGELVGFYLLLTLAGLFLSTVYFTMMAQVVGNGQVDWLQFGRKLIPNTLRMLGLFICIVIIFLMIAFPLVILASIAGMASPLASLVILFAGSILFIWVVIYLSFSIPAMLIEQKSFAAACLHSMRFVQKHMRYALPVLLGILLIDQLANNLWITADDGSWLTVVSVAGHAFVATALVTATFIFYHDRVVGDEVVSVSAEKPRTDQFI